MEQKVRECKTDSKNYRFQATGCFDFGKRTGSISG